MKYLISAEVTFEIDVPINLYDEDDDWDRQSEEAIYAKFWEMYRNHELTNWECEDVYSLESVDEEEMA